MTHQTAGGLMIAGRGRRMLMAAAGIVERHQFGFFPVLIGSPGPRGQGTKAVAFSTQRDATLLGLVSTLALLGIRDQGNRKTIGPGDQARRLLGSDMTILGRERGLQLRGLCRRTDLVTFPLKDRTKGLIGQTDLAEPMQVLAGLAITAVQAHATDHLSHPLRVLLA